MVFEVRQRLIPVSDTSLADLTVTIWRWDTRQGDRRAEGAALASGIVRQVDVPGYVGGLRSTYLDDTWVSLEAFQAALAAERIR